MLEQYAKFDMVKPHRPIDEQPVTALSLPERKVPGANMGPTWGLSAPDGPHVGPRNPAIRVSNDLAGKHNRLQSFLRLRQPSQPRDVDWGVGCFWGISIHQYLFVLPCEGNCWFDCANKSIIGPGIDMTSVADCYGHILLYDDQYPFY